VMNHRIVHDRRHKTNHGRSHNVPFDEPRRSLHNWPGIPKDFPDLDARSSHPLLIDRIICSARLRAPLTFLEPIFFMKFCTAALPRRSF